MTGGQQGTHHVVAIKGNKMGFHHIFEIVHLHHVILLKALLCSYELNTLDACWIASTCGVIVVDAESIGLLILDVMPIDIIIALDNVLTLRGSINCSTVIRSPTVYLLS